MLEPSLELYYISLFSNIIWVVELGIVNISIEFSFLVFHMSLPRACQIEAVVHAFYHLGQNYNSRLAFDLI